MNEAGEVLLQIKGLKKYYPIYKGMLRKASGYILKAVDGVDLSVSRGETLGVVGESGCGKTTMGKCIVRLIDPTDGEIFYKTDDGHLIDISKCDRKVSFELKKKIQLIFQDPYSSLNPAMTIYNTLNEPLKLHGMKERNKRLQKIESLLDSVNLSAEYMYRYPHELSGGQRQRVCIARALSVGPELIICDEPVSALDVSIQAQVLNIMKDLQKNLGLSYIFIAHDLSIVEYMSDRVAVMYLGNVVELAPADNLNTNCLHPYTKALFSAVPVPEYGRKKKRIVLKGDVSSTVVSPSGCKFHPRCEICSDICRNKRPVLKKVGNLDNHYVACHFAGVE